MTRTDKTFIIGEVAQAHEGSLGIAHAFVDAIASAGADAVKFQTHIAAAESTPGEPWRVKFSFQDKTRYDYWKRMEFTEEQWRGLKSHADHVGLKFLSSPFSLEAVQLLTRVGVAAWKVASGEVASESMFEAMAKTRLPIMLSTGMSALSEIDQAVDRIKQAGLELTILQCTSTYPTQADRVGLNVISEFRERYSCKVGLSDHSGTIYAGLAAATMEADALEVHVALSKEMFGPDVLVSLTTGELRQLVDGVRFIEKALANPVNKDAVAQELQPMRDLFTKSVVARVDLPRGRVLERGDLTLKKPGTGLAEKRLKDCIGRKLRRVLRADELVLESNLE